MLAPTCAWTGQSSTDSAVLFAGKGHMEKSAVPIMNPGENHSQGSLYVNVHGLKLKEMLSEKQNEGFRKLSACVLVHLRSQQSTLLSLPGAEC